ncbi:tyrosine-type recombinase/integrase [uncultured Ligilactobacillus sp.]|uniref:tyrosine-type recombinase/integrase n=1 Tax=uncultured Ligilactobacillus sp. TaxID=2837633 RepID=UPI00272AB9DF|nr:tyrosine-type recombinase/integrase [uncultured Ligilactobacillus sp.]
MARKSTYNVQPFRSETEIDDFLRRTKNSKRDVFLFLFGLNTGLRMSDIVKLRVRDINKPEPIITEKKTGKKKRLFLDGIQDIVQEYIKDMKDDDDQLFPSRQGGHITVNTVYKLYVKIGHELGRDDIGCHTLRKTYGRFYYLKTHDIATLMYLFNHSSEKITKRYIGITDDDDAKSSLKGFRIGVKGGEI